MKKYAILSDKEQAVTACNDVVLLMEFKGEYSSHSVYLYKTYQIDCDRTPHGEVFFLLEGDSWASVKYPIVITKETADEILKDPQKGITLASLRHSDRVR